MRTETDGDPLEQRPLEVEVEIEPTVPAPKEEVERERERIDRDDERAKRDDPASKAEHMIFEEGPASPIAADIEEPEEHL